MVFLMRFPVFTGILVWAVVLLAGFLVLSRYEARVMKGAADRTGSGCRSRDGQQSAWACRNHVYRPRRFGR